jgi:AcrR family transcriptional regulator
MTKEDRVGDAGRSSTGGRLTRGRDNVPTRILAASRRLLARHGLEALTISAIAAEAGVYSSAIFYHFGGKDGLWAALVDQLLREAESLAQSDLLAVPVGRERIDRAVETYDMIGGPGLQAAFFETLVPALRHPDLRKSLRSLYEDGRDKLAADLGADEHPEQLETLRLAGQIVLAFTDGINVQRLIDPDADYAPAIALFEEMLADALRPVLGFDDEMEVGDGNARKDSKAQVES